jgi:RIO-like serine/threonine protein kinase
MADRELLKKDLFGEIRIETRNGQPVIVRDTRSARPQVRALARAMMRREARALAALEGVDGVPGLRTVSDSALVRDYVAGKPRHRCTSNSPAYFRDAARLLRCLHRNGVVHNDLAKEPNLLVCPNGRAAFVDFQLAMYAPVRGRLFRLLAWDDIRHLLKHKRTYCAGELTRRENRILQTPSLPSRLFRRTVKPVYLLVTRQLLGWADREGTYDRGART